MFAALQFCAARMRLPLVIVVGALLVTACGGSSLVPPRQGLVTRDVSFPMRQMVFPSGLRVVVERDRRTPLVGLFLVVGSGSTSDPRGKEGLAHYIEHLTFRSRPFGKSSFRGLLERANAGVWSALTGLDATVYYELGPASSLNELLRLEGIRMRAPVVNVTPEMLRVELDVVRSELRQRNETGLLGEALGSLQAMVFPASHPYARPVIGTHDSLSSIGLDDVEAFLKASYRPDNMTLLVLGDVDLESIKQAVMQALPPDLLGTPAPAQVRKRWPDQALEPPDPPPGELSHKEGSVATPELWIAWSLPRAFDLDAYLMDIVADAANDVLVGAEQEDDDIAFVSSSVIAGKKASMLMCRVALHRGSHPTRSLDHVLNRIHLVWTQKQDIRTIQASALLFANRKRSAVVGMLMEDENLLARGVSRALSTHFNQDPTLYKHAMKHIAALEQKQMLGYASRYLDRNRARAVLFTPRAGGGALPDAVPIGASALDEENLLPIQLTTARLHDLAPPPDLQNYVQTTLSNGLDVILGRRVGIPTVAVELMLRGGLAAAPDPAAAKAAMLLAVPHDRWHGSPLAFGGRMDRGITADKTWYKLEGSAGNIGIMVAILAERVQSMHIDPGAWTPFQTYTLPYILLAEQKPETMASQVFLAKLLAGHPYGRIPTGKDMQQTSAEAAQDWLDATHIPRNAVLAIVGEIDTAEVAKIVQEQFGGWKDSGPAAPAPVPPRLVTKALVSPQLVVVPRPFATQAQIHFGCVLPPVNSSATDVRHDVMAQLVQDRIHQVLRDRLGVSYGFTGRAWVFRGGSAYFELQGAVDGQKIGVALGVLRETLGNLASVPVSDNVLSWAKLRVARHRTTWYMTNSHIASSLLGTINLDHGLEGIGHFANELASIEAANVQQDVRSCLSGRPTLSIVGDDHSVRQGVKEGWSR